MKLEELAELWEKKVKVICLDGVKIVGFFNGFTRATDNTPAKDEIALDTKKGLIGIYLDEIHSINAI